MTCRPAATSLLFIHAPRRLRFELGVRADGPPLVTFGPGERIEK